MKKSGEAKLLVILALVLLLGGGSMYGLKYLQDKSDPANPANRPTPTAVTWDAAKFEEAIKKSRHVKGPADATVSLIEFADFQCPSCRRAYNEVLEPLFKSKKSVRLAFFHYPLTEMHQFARAAAAATEAAGKQGKFWELYSILFEGEKTELSEQYIEDCAKKAGLDMTRFKTDRVESALLQNIDTDLQYALGLKVNSTPTFILKDDNGRISVYVGGKDLKTALAKITF
jgi:protein-disulfide isomerase